METKNLLRGLVGERYNPIFVFVVITFGILLRPNVLELRVEILSASTEFDHLSHHEDEFFVTYVTMPWHSMNHRVTQV